MTELTPSGDPIYRYSERQREFELAIGDEATINLINAHIEQHIGPVAAVFHEIVSDLVHVDIHVVSPTANRNFYTLVTSGMSDRAMVAPEGFEACGHAELMICLPPNWPMEQEAWKDEAHYWPIRWLKMLARLPHEHGSWLWQFHSVPNGDPAQPFVPGTALTGMLLMPPVSMDAAFRELRVDEAKNIHFHALVPVTSDEMQLKLEKGAEALFDGFDRHNISELLDVGRKSTLRQKPSWFNFFRKR